MKSNDLFKALSAVTTARPPFRKQNDIEVDDVAPIPLFIGIGLPVVIGFIILVLICCFCRRRRVPAAGTAQPANQAASLNYQRAPEADGMGPAAYPMTAVTNSYASYPTGQPVGPPHYTQVPPGVHPPMHPAYPTQQVPPPAAAHFTASLQPYPSHQYMAIVPPPSQAHQSLSHSSQASSVSGHTVDPLVPSSSPSIPQQYMQQQQQQQHLLLHQQQIKHQQELFHHHQQQQQQQYIYHHHPSSGLSRESPAPFHYATLPYMMAPPGGDHSTAIIISTAPTPTPTNVSQTLISSPPANQKSSLLGQTAKTPLKDDGTDQDLGYSEGEE